MSEIRKTGSEDQVYESYASGINNGPKRDYPIKAGRCQCGQTSLNPTGLCVMCSEKRRLKLAGERLNIDKRMRGVKFL